jgi:UDP-N-acetylmuramoyl-tripeptide--D-alanyl-D-alanine ligase
MQLANYRRKKLNPITVAITGSSGKTTTKEIVYSVLSQKFKTHKTFSNHNNEIGFCETVMTMPENTEVLIVEMGMRGLGEIEILSKFSEPDYAVITNAGSAHIGRLGSLDNIAKAKSEIVKYLKPTGTLISQNNDRIKKFVSDFKGKVIYHDLNDFEIIEREQSYTKFIYKNKEYELNVEGDYNADNSVTAIELGYLLGMSYDEISKGLTSYKPIEKRWETQNINGINIINDSYNANPESMKASVSTFLQLYKNPVVVLGDMGELGDYTDELHRGVGQYLANLPQVHGAKFLTVGEYAKEIGEVLEKSAGFVKNFENNDEVSKYIIDNMDIGTTIFLKASRTMKFEEIIAKLGGGRN